VKVAKMSSLTVSSLLEAADHGGNDLRIEGGEQLRTGGNDGAQDLRRGAADLPADVVVSAVVALIIVGLLFGLVRLHGFAFFALVVGVVGVVLDVLESSGDDLLQVRLDLLRAAQYKRLERSEAVLAELLVSLVLATGGLDVLDNERDDLVQVLAEAVAYGRTDSTDGLHVSADVVRLLGLGRTLQEMLDERREELLRRDDRQAREHTDRALAGGAASGDKLRQDGLLDLLEVGGHELTETRQKIFEGLEAFELGLRLDILRRYGRNKSGRKTLYN